MLYFFPTGGGGLALLGTGTLHTWSDSLVNLVPRLTDDTLIDKSLLMDDSAYRLARFGLITIPVLINL